MNTELFTGRAKSYAASRPSYPASAIDYILSLAPKNAVFADIGAGTGKLTELIAQREVEVFAVEPNGDMLEQLTKTCEDFPNVKIVSAPAEATTLADNSVDVITVAQALHWFEPADFIAECKRIGKPNWILVSVYNVTPGGTSPHYSEDTSARFFANSIVREFPNTIFYTRKKWTEYMTSHSHDPLPNDPTYDEHIREINEIFDKENIDGFIKREVVTRIFIEGDRGTL